MDIPGITWKGESIEDVEILRELPAELVRVLSETNGFILHQGAIHVRGACLTPDWHSLRAAWRGAKAFHVLYEDVRPSDIPFAQDLVGNQFLIRESTVIRLFAETGEMEPLAPSLQDFFTRLSSDIERFLNVLIGFARISDHQRHHGEPVVLVGHAQAFQNDAGPVVNGKWNALTGHDLPGHAYGACFKPDQGDQGLLLRMRTE